MPIPTYNRPAQVLQAIYDWNASLSAEDRSLKHAKMALSPYLFYRGTNRLFWADFVGDWRLSHFGSPRTRTWLQGDLHAYNFGAFTDDSGEVVYSVNDFDESIFADYQYDAWRMAISIVLLARENGTPDRDAVKAGVSAFAEAYLDTLREYRGNAREKKTQFTRKNTSGALQKFLKEAEKDNTRKKMLEKWTKKMAGERRFDLSLEKLDPISVPRREEIIAAMPGYRATLVDGGPLLGDAYFIVKDAARRQLAGTGSLGTPRYYLLLQGAGGANEQIILDVKRQFKPAAYSFLSATEQAEYDAHFENDACTHAAAFRALTKGTDDHLGWMQLSDGWYSVRERTFVKEAFPAETLTSARKLRKIAEQWGRVLATVHARADKDFATNLTDTSLEDEVHKLTDGRHRAFRRMVCGIAFDHADQVQADWDAFLQDQNREI